MKEENLRKDERLDTPESDELFFEHLQLENNKRILFSAKFGQGKTWFLHKFFEKNNGKYRAFFVSPIKYEMDPNDKIVDYLRVNVAMEIVQAGGKQSYNAALNNLKAQLAHKSCEKFYGIFNLLPIGKVVEAIKELPGKLFPIENLIKKVLGSKGFNDKENILIIDDFDRLDPKNVFKIINLCLPDYSQCEDGKDIMGFDKIIIVADMNNLNEMFKHFYGLGVDNRGYFSKFYSISPYVLDIFKDLKTSLEGFLYNMNTQNNTLWDGTFRAHWGDALLLFVSYFAYRSKIIGIREITEMAQVGCPWLSYRTLDKASHGNPNVMTPIDREFIDHILGKGEDLEKNLDIIIKNVSTIPISNETPPGSIDTVILKLTKTLGNANLTKVQISIDELEYQQRVLIASKLLKNCFFGIPEIDEILKEVTKFQDENSQKRFVQ